ncbi:hypothetical protein LguiA_024351 [Lonicera macranthoides]
MAHMKLVVGVISGGAGDATTVKLIRCRENERQALLELKQGFLDEDGVLSSWGSQEEEDCCKWKGIKCSNRTGHVIVLDLNATAGFSYLSGKVSPSLLQLNHLKYLDLSHNIFQLSPIPEFIGSLSRLKYLNLAYSGFAGTIPQQLGNLSNLHSLDLSLNEVTVKKLEWLSHLRSLRHLDLSYIDLEKTDLLQQIHKLSFLTELHLTSCSLRGTMFPLLPVTNSSSIPLAIVDLSYNNFSSFSTDNWLFNLSNSLVHIDMSVNPLRGSIPEAFGSMVSLENLYLGDCELDGELPNSLKNLSRLKSLDLSLNDLSGQVYEFFQTWAANGKNSLEILDLSFNQLSGLLPDITKLPSLRQLKLAYNHLNGSFPETFCQISRLVCLDLSHNQMTGSLPDPTLFPSLIELYLDNNHFDTISKDYLSNLPKLKVLDLSFNSLTWEFSTDLAPPFQLDIIRLANCNLGTHFPKWIQSQNNFFELDISGAGISDTIPNWFWDLSPRLAYLNISYNQLHGVLPDLSLKFVDVVRIDLSSNCLKGPITSFPPNVTVLHLSKNMFTGSVSFLCATAYMFLYSLDLSDNQLSGELPDCWMHFDQLNILNLANNKFFGKIPTSIGFLNQLQILHLSNNTFIGELPPSLKNCNDLKLLDLSENELSGEVPTWMGTHLKSLIVISLRNNEFFGSIPHHICSLSFAQVLDLSRNNIAGSIPRCINNLTSLVERNSTNAIVGLDIWTPTGMNSGINAGKDSANALVQWKGKESEYEKTLGLLKIIDLSSNKLGGKIPQEFASLEGLISLNLSRNNLTGNFIQKIGQLKMLEVLDLSINQLSGEIPTGLASLNLLSVLDLSNNNFMGKIPSGTQLQSFNASTYAGNEKLCGLPLPRKCSEDETNILPPSVGHGKDNKNEENEDKFVTMGFYISVVFGFIVGFWGFLGPILLRRTWRHAYFSFLEKIKDWIFVTPAVNIARLRRKLKN